jgi:hypothetical protein
MPTTPTRTHFNLKSLYIPDSLHSILRKIGPVIQIVVLQFVCKMTAKKYPQV